MTLVLKNNNYEFFNHIDELFPRIPKGKAEYLKGATDGLDSLVKEYNDTPLGFHCREG